MVRPLVARLACVERPLTNDLECWSDRGIIIIEIGVVEDETTEMHNSGAYTR
jgi:uracil DNA glycosylase